MIRTRKPLLSLFLVWAMLLGACFGIAPSAVSEAAATVAISNKKVALYQGDTKAISLKQNGKKISKGVTWKTSKKAVATVTSAGKITAKSGGSAKITAKYRGKTYTCVVNVTALKLSMSKSKVSLIAGDSDTIFLKNNSKKVASGVTWKSSNTSVAAVSNGKITAKKKGTAKITATFHKKSATCTVTVAALNIKLSKSSLSLDVDKTATINLSKNGTKLSSGVTWNSSNPYIATVSNGKITAKNAGTTDITAKYNNKTYTCKLTVKEVVLPVELSVTNLTMKANERKAISLYEGDNIVTSGITWRSSNQFVAVHESGFIRSMSPSTTTTVDITATYKNKTYTCKVTVEAAEAVEEPVKLSSTSFTLEPTAKAKLSLLKGSTDITKSATWTTSDSGIVRISDLASTGYIQAVKDGEAVITATYNGKTYECYVVVESEEPMPTDINLSETELTIKIGDIETLVLYEDGEEVPASSVTWKSSNDSVAMVYSGTVQGKSAGKAKISATYKNRAYSCDVLVEEDIVETDIELSDSKITLRKGKTKDLKLTEDGKTVSNATWKSSDESVAKVYSGTVEAKAPGTAIISATYKGNTYECEVKVTSKYAMEETGFDPDKDMEIETGTKDVKVEFECTDEEVLKQYKEEAEKEDSIITVEGNTVSYTAECNTATYTFEKLPGTPEELYSIPLETMFDPMACNILAIAMMDEEKLTAGEGFNMANDMYDLPVFDMFDTINGDRLSVSNTDKSGAIDSIFRLIRTGEGNGRLCYFDYATPENSYNAKAPFSFTLVEGPYVLPAMKSVNSFGSYPERHMVLIYFAGDDSPRYNDVYYSTKDEKWYSWNTTWKNLIADIKEAEEEW